MPHCWILFHRNKPSGMVDDPFVVAVPFVVGVPFVVMLALNVLQQTADRRLIRYRQSLLPPLITPCRCRTISTITNGGIRAEYKEVER